MSKIQFSVLTPEPNLKHILRRVLISTGRDLQNEIIPIAPTGFDYLTYSRFPLTLHYKNRHLTSNDKLYVTGQINEEAPYFTINGHFFHIGLELLPASLYYLLGLNGSDLTDNGLSLKQIRPELAVNLIKELDQVQDPVQAGRLLQNAIAKLPYENEVNADLEKALRIIYQHNGNIPIKSVVEKLDMSARHFRRVFKHIIGIGPKQYCKIIQFNSVIEALQLDDKELLYDVMLQNGYYDHAHFINDFKSCVGQTPQQFLKSGHKFLKNYLGTFKAEH